MKVRKGPNIMSLGKQAKTLSEGQIKAMLSYVDGKSTTPRDRVMVLLSVRLGLRAKEIASARWSMVTDAEGKLSDVLALPNTASKGKHGGRELPLPQAVRAALAILYGDGKLAGQCLILNTRGQPMRANGVAVWFGRLYQALGFEGCSSHSGRRSAITAWARGITAAGGSLRDVQHLAGHASLDMTSRYVERSPDAIRRLLGAG
jgi:integrase